MPEPQQRNQPESYAIPGCVTDRSVDEVKDYCVIRLMVRRRTSTASPVTKEAH